MRFISGQKLTELQKNSSKIRNICIMAHVDHGKTTLADSLVACNGIISSKMVGKLRKLDVPVNHVNADLGLLCSLCNALSARYMDSRKDEQERGITMKSSSIALYYNTGGNEFLVNLIDSPGHVDFSSEVSTAVRLCDGAIIVVDVLEGVCPQTRVALKQAWMENIRLVLVLNKIDRLILEMKLTPLDAYIHLTQVLEQVNAVMGSLFTTEVLGRTGDMPDAKATMTSTGEQLYDWSDGLENADDSQLYFSPDHGNVAFASAVDGWGFCITDFAKVYSIKLGLSQEELQRCLWGDFYLHAKTKKIIKGAQEKAKKPLFVQLVLENIWALYDIIVVRKDKEKVLKIVESLNIKVTSRDLRHTDTKVQLHAVFSQWLPLATTVLDMVCVKLPAPNDLSEEKVERLMCSQTQSLDTMPSESQALKQAFLDCSSQETAPVIVFISKMFPIERKSLPQNKPRVLTPEEMAERRAQARLRHAAQIAGLGDSKAIAEEHTSIPEPVETIIESEDVFIAFARVFSGCLKKGQEVYVLGPKHNPAQALDMVKRGITIDPNLTLKDLKFGEHITKVTISELYLMMGRELEILEEVPAGNVLGIGGLEEHVLNTATLSTQLACPAFSELQLMAVPILRVAVEPTKHSDLPALVRGLKLLNQADACVQVIVQETGELVLVTAGEVHLERCLDDLRQRYAKVGVNASEPIVPFKETIVPPPIVDMVNEAIQEQNTSTKKDNDDPSINSDGLVTTITPNKQSTVKIRATPLPSKVTAILDNNSELIRVLDSFMNNKNNESMLSEDMELLNLKEINQVMAGKTLKALEVLRKDLSEVFKKAGGEWSESSTNEIWSFGPRRCGPNVFINRVPGHSGRCVWQRHVKEKCKESLLEYDSSFINGFQMVTLAGPLCEEPMMGVAFIVEDWTIEPSENVQSSAPYGPLSGQIMSAVKESCRKAFQAQPQRLMAAMYSCSVQTNAEVLGKMYAVLNRRHGRILSSDMTQGSATFNVVASMPVVESFSFASEMRKHTSGLANPQLIFSHWEVIDVDPYWSPRTEEEYLHFGDKADSDNLARKYMDSVRRRKGLAVEDKLVQFAEKQRTLGRNK